MLYFRNYDRCRVCRVQSSQSRERVMILQPTRFVPHGAPTPLLHPGAAGAALAELSQRLPEPRAVVIVSVYWDTSVARVGFSVRPETIHDFMVFRKRCIGCAIPQAVARKWHPKCLMPFVQRVLMRYRMPNGGSITGPGCR